MHEADHNGHKPSLSINPGDKQPFVLNCHAGCDFREIEKALGLEKPAPLNGQQRIVATYSYRDLSGNEVRQKIRYEPKDFRIRHADASGNWVYKAGPGPAVLYRLPELLAGMFTLSRAKRMLTGWRRWAFAQRRTLKARRNRISGRNGDRSIPINWLARPG